MGATRATDAHPRICELNFESLSRIAVSHLYDISQRLVRSGCSQTERSLGVDDECYGRSPPTRDAIMREPINAVAIIRKGACIYEVES